MAWLGLVAGGVAAAVCSALAQDGPGRTAASETRAASCGGSSSPLTRSLAAWASGGLIRQDRLQALVADPKVQGEPAVTLATLIHHLGPVRSEPVCWAGLDAWSDRRELEQTYQVMARKAQQIRPALFAQGRPHFASLRQGPVGACYFIASLGWLTVHDPDRIVHAIRPSPDGGWTVTFPSGDQATVSPLTETEILNSSAGETLNDGVWVVVLEKALGLVQGQRSARRAAIADPILRINGGSSRAALRLWTGHPVATLHLDQPADAGKVAAALRAMQAQRLMAEASISRNHPPSALPHGHSYTVLGFDPRRDAITLWNPWGDDFDPDGPVGPNHGWPRRHGVFTVRLRDFVATFSTLSIEQGF